MVGVIAAIVSTIFHVCQPLKIYYDSCLAIIIATPCTGTFGPTMNISLEGSAYLGIMANRIGSYICNDIGVYWEILRADGELEVYTVANRHEYYHGRYETLADRGLSFAGYCDLNCILGLTITPTDIRYDGAQITGVVNLPGCYNATNTTDTTVLSIQG